MTALRVLYELFPPKIRDRIKSVLRANGHGVSQFDNWKARDHALGKKRLDRVAEHMAQLLAAAQIASLENRACLGFGVGYVPSEVLIFYLLGAKPVMATDYNAIARFSKLVVAARAADQSKIIAALSPYSPVGEIVARLEPLLSGTASNAQDLIESRISYLAPYDMSATPISPGFDFIHSLSVLEHLPAPLAQAILKNLNASLLPGGKMVHEIDLCDHLDMENAPLAFLSRSGSYDPATDADRRGNRLRRSDWLNLLSTLPVTATTTLYESQHAPGKVPIDLLPEFAIRDKLDLETSWIGLLTCRLD